MKTKNIKISGLAFDTKWITSFFSIKWGEEADMERLSEEAKKGWITTGITGVSYVLTEGKPEDLTFTIDYRDNPDQDYFEIFMTSGWEHVASIDYIHLFKATTGTKPIHTSIETKLEKLSHEMRRFGLLTLVAILSLFAANALTSWATRTSVQWLFVSSLILNVLALVFLVFTIMPFFGYWVRVHKIKKNRI